MNHKGGLSMACSSDALWDIKSRNAPVVIVGAGVVGEVLLSICNNAGIIVDFFCDSSYKVADKGTFCGLRVFHISQIPSSHEDALFIISAASIKDVVERLLDFGHYDWLAGGILLKDIDVSQSDTSLDYAKFAIENCILCHDGYLHPDKLFMRSVDIIITERCSLKCKDCSNLMQYYKHPKDCDTGLMLRSIDALCAVVDEVMDFRVIGGEVFINKDWPVVVERLINEPKARRVVLYTNATMLPPRRYIKPLQHEKVLVIASDYGALSKNLSRMKELFRENGIAHHVFSITEWLSCSDIERHNRSFDENRRNCSSRAVPKTWRVCRTGSCSAVRTRPMPFGSVPLPINTHDYVDLLREPLDAGNIVELKRTLRHYLLRKPYMSICDYCNGRPLSGVEVKPYVQVDAPLPYRRYFQVSYDKTYYEGGAIHPLFLRIKLTYRAWRHTIY